MFLHSGVVPLIDPESFARRIPHKLRTASGEQLKRACEIIARGGNADSWIRAVLRARDPGTIGAAVARHLVVQFAEASIDWLMYNEAPLADITVVRRGAWRSGSQVLVGRGAVGSVVRADGKRSSRGWAWSAYQVCFAG